MSLRTSSTSKSLTDSDSDSVDSLFDEPSMVSMPMAMRHVPPIPGLFLPPVFVSQELAARITHESMRAYFEDTDVNQIMLFGRAMSGTEDDVDARMGRGLPPTLIQLLHQLSALLQPWIPSDLHEHLFPLRGDTAPRARQAILNLYRPGEGISSHVDLLNRFDDGIIGVSLCGSCVMSFKAVTRDTQSSGPANETREGEGRKWDLYLPERSILVMSKDARYNWTHGISGRTHDLVENEHTGENLQIGPCLIKRGVRLSITFRWLLHGADTVGEPEQ